MDDDPFDDLVFICTQEFKRVYDGIYCENKHGGGYGHCGDCNYLRIQSWRNDVLVKEYFGDLTPVDHKSEDAINRFMEDNPDFLELV